VLLAFALLAAASGARADLAEDARSAAHARDYSARPLWTELANRGDPDAEYSSARCTGPGAAEAGPGAGLPLVAASAGGHARSQFRVAGLYRDG
jgi:hypothetical protein